MRIGDLDLDERVMVVAEIGNNHEGDFGLAQELIGLAAEAGVDAVKFQTFRTEHYVARRDRRRFEQLRSFELTIEQFDAIPEGTKDPGLLKAKKALKRKMPKRRANQQYWTESQFEKLAATAAAAGLRFLSTPFDLDSVRCLAGLVDAFKISSGDNTFFPLLQAVARTGKPVILSSGLATLDQLREAQAVIAGARGEPVARDLAILHCVSSYPVPPAEANLAVIPRLREALGCTVGYSDHTLGIEAAGVSVALGARIVEKHFTHDRNHSDFRDHRLSADPAELRRGCWAGSSSSRARRAT